MCGIVSIICKNSYGFSSTDLDVFETLLLVDTLRGNDSTGVFLVDNNGNVDIAKSTDCGATFLKSNEWSDIRKKALRCGFALVGHNRKATRGTITDENAHPFWVEDKLVLVHNGSMWGSHKHLADTEVDSHAIAHVLANEPDTEKALQTINAAYALIWYDIQGKKLNVIRNKERPLHHVATTNTWIMASEDSMLDFATKRHRSTIVAKGIYLQPEFLMSTWALVEKKVELSHKELDCTFRGEYKTTTHYGQYVCAWKDTEHVSQDPAGKTTSVTALPPLRPIFENWVEQHQNHLYNWQDPLAYGRFKHIRDYLLANDCQVRVVVQDFDLALSTPTDDVLLIGLWANHDGSIQIPIVFPIKEGQLQAFMDEEGESSFYVTVKNHYWKSSSVVLHKDEDVQRGYPYVWAENAKPVVKVVAGQQVH
jgi:Glutamine amidotransferase domain